ncbi:stabilizer of axonemal microtubules 2-like isoform X2 [Gigantopelta aegis]|uniref:stabilizer of axonemal microtubules 2-like isoform X2 n=1 Tax=Gigantopelta aegis TaxID=1735272 RepID=UPI001B88D40C|nr:stabilizer of axonemal microtubules 2-like isoform X2 [Gigantopelta aegis]
MTKKCICEICTCGRHRCPHRPYVQTGYNDRPCMLSEYKTTYREHCFQPVKSFKPVQDAVRGDVPLEDKTTNRVDYIAYPVVKPHLHQPDVYRTPDGEQDHLTSYVRDYPGKYATPAKAIKREGQHQVPSKFEGEPTYKSDYQKWTLDGRPKKHEQPAWMPPQDEFRGISTFTNDYKRYFCQPPRQSMKPKEAVKVSDSPFDSATGYRDAYIKHPLQAKFSKPQEVYRPSGIPLDGMTTFKKDYQGCPGNKADTCKPSTEAYRSDAPLEDLTTFRNDYRKWPMERPYARAADEYKKPEGDMDMKTTHNIAYKQYPLQPHVARRPASATQRLPGAFDGVTNYSTDYQPWDLGGRPRPMMKPEYSPNLAPFEGMSTQKAHYIAHPRCQSLKSFKPDSNAIRSDAPFDDGTMYRMEYTPKYIGPCPAAILNTQASGYSYIETDPRGHKVYRPVYETVAPINKLPTVQST